MSPITQIINISVDITATGLKKRSIASMIIKIPITNSVTPLNNAANISKRLYPKVLDLVACFRSEEHTSELQSRFDLVCRLLLEKKNNGKYIQFMNRQ